MLSFTEKNPAKLEKSFFKLKNYLDNQALKSRNQLIFLSSIISVLLFFDFDWYVKPLLPLLQEYANIGWQIGWPSLLEEVTSNL